MRAWLGVGLVGVLLTGCAPVVAPSPPRAARSAAPAPAPIAPKPPPSADREAARKLSAEAFSRWARGDLAGARKLFLEASQADPSAPEAHYSLGTMEERLGDRDAAIAAYRSALAVAPELEPAALALAFCLARSGRLDEASAFLGEKLKASPESAALLVGLAEVRSAMGDAGEAQRLATRALEIDGSYVPATLALAHAHWRARRLKAALPVVESILEDLGSGYPARDPNNAEAHALRAAIYIEEGKRADAIAALEHAVARRPDLTSASVILAHHHLDSADLESALAVLERARQFGDGTALHLYLAVVYRRLARTADAKRELDWVAARAPDEPGLHYELGVLHLFADSLGDTTAAQRADTAIDSLQRFLRLTRNPAARELAERLVERAKQRKAELAATAPPAAAP